MRILRKKPLMIAFLIMVSSCIFMPKKIAITDLMPRETDVPGWVVTRQVKSSGKKIAAVTTACALYNPQEYVAVLYTNLSDKKKTVTAEVFTFSSALDAFGAFSVERGFAESNKFVSDDDYSSARGLFFRVGKNYVRIAGEGLGEQAVETLDQFRVVLQQNMKMPSNIDLFPDNMFIFSADRSTRNIIYHKHGIDSIPGTGPLFVTRRPLFEKMYLSWNMKLPGAYDADRKFQDILKQGSGELLLNKIGKLPVAVRIIKDREHLLICCYKNWIFGVLDAETMDRGNNILVVLFSEIKTRGYKK